MSVHSASSDVAAKLPAAQQLLVIVSAHILHFMYLYIYMLSKNYRSDCYSACFCTAMTNYMHLFSNNILLFGGDFRICSLSGGLGLPL